MNKEEIFKKISGGLIVSCQALPNEPLYGNHMMAKMALAAKLGGAVAIRTSGYEDIVDIKNKVDLPIIGLIKKWYNDSDVYITPTYSEVESVFKGGADIVAVDATNRIRPGKVSLKEIVDKVKINFPGKILLADIATLQEAIEAEKLGFNIVSTTLSGNTDYTKDKQLPDFELLRDLAGELTIPGSLLFHVGSGSLG